MRIYGKSYHYFNALMKNKRIRSSPLLLLPVALVSLIGSVRAIETNDKGLVDCVAVHRQVLAAVQRGELREEEAIYITASCFKSQGGGHDR